MAEVPEPITEEALRKKLLAPDRTTAEKHLAAHGEYPQLVEWANLNGYELVGLLENGVSGHTPLVLRRQLVQAIWQVADDPTFHGIVFPSTDRQARDRRAFEGMQDAMWWVKKHLYVCTDTGAVVDTVPTETGIERLERKSRELESELAAIRLLLQAHKARMAKAARLGNVGGRSVPAWFQDRVQLGGRKSEFAPNPERLQWALRMRDRHAEGWSGPRIADELNRHGLRTAGGKPFGRNRVLEVRQQLERVPLDILAIWTSPLSEHRSDGVGRVVAAC
jgi:hypothetical protein